MATKNNSPFRLYKRGEIWHAYISFTAKGHRYVFRTSTGATDREVATKFCMDRIDAIVKAPELTHEITLDEAAARWALEVLQYQNSVQSRAVALNIMLRLMDRYALLSQITKSDVSDLVAKLQNKGRKPSTINRYLSLLSAICTRAREYWDCRTPDFKILQFRQKEPIENIKYFKDMAVVQKIVRNAAPHLQPIILTGIYTGMRLGRILTLTWDQIDIKNKIIIFRGKNGLNQSVPVVPALERIFRNIPAVGEYVFTYRGRPIASIKNGWAAALKRAGVPYQSFHTLRHTVATWLLRDSHDLRLVKEVLGHKTITTTIKYVHLTNDRTAEGLNHLFQETSPKDATPQR